MHTSYKRFGSVLGLWLLGMLLLGLWPAGANPAAAQGTQTGFLGGNGMRGVSFVHTPSAPFGSDAALQSMRDLRATGANWVSIVVTFRQALARSTEFFRGPQDATDQGIAQMIAYAHSQGMKVMLQPVVLSERDGVWNGYFSPEDTNEWFDNYSTMLEGYARTAQQMQVDLFCIGTEFFTLTQPQYANNWRTIISDVRRVYFGPLTYSANWGDKKNPEFATIDWWDQLDYIGISAYFPLSWNNFLTEPLRAGWFSYRDPFGANAQGEQFGWFDRINAVHGRWNKPVLFTKIGFASYANSPGRWDVRPDPFRELSVQANAYDATMLAWNGVDWMQGIFWSPWYSNPSAGGPLDNGETPQGKPAEEILTTWYHK